MANTQERAALAETLLRLSEDGPKKNNKLDRDDGDDDAMMLLELEEDDDDSVQVSKAAKPGLKSSTSKRARKAAPVPINYTYSDYKGGEVSQAQQQKKPSENGGRPDTVLEQVDQAIRDNVLAQAIGSVGLSRKRKPVGVVTSKKSSSKLPQLSEQLHNNSSKAVTNPTVKKVPPIETPQPPLPKKRLSPPKEQATPAVKKTEPVKKAEPVKKPDPAVKKRERKIKEKAARKRTKGEVAASERQAFTEAVVFDSPALAAVKRMFNQLKQDVRAEENRLGLNNNDHVDAKNPEDSAVETAGEEKYDLCQDSQSQLKFMARQDIVTLQQRIVEHTQKKERLAQIETLNQQGMYNDVEGILASLTEVVNKRLTELDKIEYRARIERKYCSQLIALLRTQVSKVQKAEELLRKQKEEEVAFDLSDKKVLQNQGAAADQLGDLLNSQKRGGVADETNAKMAVDRDNFEFNAGLRPSAPLSEMNPIKGAYELLNLDGEHNNSNTIDSLHAVTNIWKYQQSDQICNYLPSSLRSEIAEAKRSLKTSTRLCDGLPKASDLPYSDKADSDFELKDDEIFQQIEDVRGEFERMTSETPDQQLQGPAEDQQQTVEGQAALDQKEEPVAEEAQEGQQAVGEETETYEYDDNEAGFDFNF